MFQYLGPRGRLLTLGVAAAAGGGAVVSAVYRDWSGLGACLALGWLTLVTGALWGVTLAVLRTTEAVESHMRRATRRNAAGARSRRRRRPGKARPDARRGDRARNAAALPAHPKTGVPVLDRFGAKLAAPRTTSNDEVRALIEYLAKHATDRAADERELHAKLAELTTLVEAHQRQVEALLQSDDRFLPFGHVSGMAGSREPRVGS